ncbi:MAG: diacylglycerol kinase family protein [Lachnospiraceae bacterium]|nr:diacylglycerol kinase family protein [Lachnospiraceae bacterium]
MIHIFIVNPYAGLKTFSDELREKLSGFKGLNYFIFNTRCKGYEQELVKKVQNIFQDEKLRFYCCGGSGTMRNMLNGFENLENVEVAYFPCGLSNDFLKVFGKDEKRFYQIEELIEGDVITVDYIKTNHGVALNTFSLGLDSNTDKKMNDYRIAGAFGKEIPYILSLLYALFRSRPEEYIVYLDDQRVEGRLSEVVFGNGHVLGGNLYFAEESDVGDGKGIYTLGPNRMGLAMLPVIQALLSRQKDRLEKYCICGMCSRIRIRRKDGVPFAVNCDGELSIGMREWTATIVKQGLHLVVPKGVKV